MLLLRSLGPTKHASSNSLPSPEVRYLARVPVFPPAASDMRHWLFQTCGLPRWLVTFDARVDLWSLHSVKRTSDHTHCQLYEDLFLCFLSAVLATIHIASYTETSVLILFISFVFLLSIHCIQHLYIIEPQCSYVSKTLYFALERYVLVTSFSILFHYLMSKYKIVTFDF